MYEGGGVGSQRLFNKGRLESVLSISQIFPSMETKSSKKKKNEKKISKCVRRSGSAAASRLDETGAVCFC